MRRIEGKHSVLAGTQITSGAVLSLEFIVPVMVWLTAAFRPAAISPSLSRVLNDMGWIMFVAVISTVIVQIGSFAFAIFLDRRATPIFPRWYGYLNAWVALLLAPAGIIVFFHHGPFSWRGVFSFFLPLTVYTIWMFATFAMLLRAVNGQTEEEDEPPVPASVAARLAALEERVGREGTLVGA
jgi:hypothetical protein